MDKKPEIQNAVLPHSQGDYEVSSARFAKYFDLTPTGHLSLNREGVIQESNLLAARLIGLEQEKLLGRSFAILIEAESRATFDAFLKAVWSKPAKARCEIALLTTNNRPHFMLIEALADATGQTCRMTLMNITRCKQAELVLQQSEEKYRVLMQSAMDAIFIADADTGLLLDANKSAEALIGYSRAQIIGMHQRHLHPQDEAEDYAELFRQHVALQGGLVSVPAYVQHRDGRKIPVEISSGFAEIGGKRIMQGIFRDISKRKQAEKMQHECAERFRTLIAATSQIVWITNVQGDVTEDIPSWRAYTGQNFEEIKDWGWTSALHPDDVERTASLWKQAVANGTIYETEYRVRRHDGVYRDFSVRGVPVLNPDGSMREWVGMCTDITERKHTEEAMKLYALVLQNSSEGMVVTDQNNLIIAVNPAFTAITGYTLDEVRGKNPHILSSGRQDKAFYQAMWQSLKRTGHWQGEIWDKRKNGELHVKFLSINTVHNADGSVHRYVALFSDITEKKQSEELIWHQANFDTLTDLPNRRMFHDRLQQEIMKSQRAKISLALLLIDLDKFKEVNDTLGHDMGDILLKEASRRLVNCVRASDTVARLGGDEFIVLLSELTENNHAENIAQKIIAQMAEPFHLGIEATYISASVGITLYPDDATSIEALMKNADQAMYLSKYQGRNRFSYFTPALQEAAQKRLSLTNELRGALAARQFEVYYQPIVELATGNIHKAEALIRWHHPERGMVSPADFIPLAEETGLILGIGDWVFKQAVQQAKQWRSRFHESFQISVNKSPVQFHDEASTCISWPAYLEQQGIPGQCVTVEITEGLLLNAESAINKKLLDFRDAGIQVSIDDFGTGYSSLSYLKKFDIDYLKIDQSFVRNLETDTSDQALCKAIIVMAHELGFKVIAEGVETEAQRTLLHAVGCDYGQGYLFSRPVPVQAFEKLLAS